MDSGKQESGLEGWRTVAGGNRNRFAPLAASGASGQRGKRQRLSSGGTSNELSYHEKALSLNEFKSLDTGDKLDTIFCSIQHMQLTQERLLNSESVVKQMSRDLQYTTSRIKLLEYRSIDIEARNRRLNLLFRGIPEVENEVCRDIINDILKTNLEIDAYICIHRAHRLGRKVTKGRGFRQRPIIVALRDYDDVDLILSKTRLLKGTKIGINRDYPNEIVEARKCLYPKLKLLKASDPKAKIAIYYPAKLVKNGRVVFDMFPDWSQVLRGSRHFKAPHASAMPDDERTPPREIIESTESDDDRSSDSGSDHENEAIINNASPDHSESGPFSMDNILNKPIVPKASGTCSNTGVTGAKRTQPQHDEDHRPLTPGSTNGNSAIASTIHQARADSKDAG